MLQERAEPAWIAAFEEVLRRCALQKGDTVAILGETQSRPILMELARLATARLGVQVFTITLPSVFATAEPVAQSEPVPVRVAVAEPLAQSQPVAVRVAVAEPLAQSQPITIRVTITEPESLSIA